jgi:hypothetical protein
MALYIRDDSVNELAGQLAQLTGQTKTEAVRAALQARLNEVRPEKPAHPSHEEFMAGIAAIQAQVRAWGGRPRTAEEIQDDKRLMDEMWGEE